MNKVTEYFGLPKTKEKYINFPNDAGEFLFIAMNLVLIDKYFYDDDKSFEIYGAIIERKGEKFCHGYFLDCGGTWFMADNFYEIIEEVKEISSYIGVKHCY